MPESGSKADADRQKALNRENLAREVCWTTMSVSEWLDKCMPGKALPEECAKSDFKPFSTVTIGRTEKHMYKGLCNGFNDILRKLKVDKFTMRITGDHQDRSAPGTIEDRDLNAFKPDLALYTTDEDVRKVYTLPPPKVSKKPSRQADNTAPAPDGEPAPDLDTLKAMTVWAWAEFFVEVKHDPALAPFSFDPNLPETNAFPDDTEKLRSRGQLTEYAKEMAFRQHRTFVPMLSIFRNFARFLRFDRAGVFMSAPFDYFKDPKPLSTFIFRYVNGSPEACGFDSTVTLASPEESARFRALAENATLSDYLKDAIEKATTPGWPIQKLSVEAPWSRDGITPVRLDDPSSKRELLVGRPMFKSHSMMGRGTRGFVAYDLKDRRVVFLKDYWRTHLGPQHLTEAQIYSILSRPTPGEESTFLLTLLSGGDVLGGVNPYQRTLTDTLVADIDPTLGIPGRVHTRLVFKEVCRPLVSFRDTRELVSVMHDALRAHQRAWERFGLLHRDLSAGNILILDAEPDDKHRSEARTIGLLSDWELAKRRADIEVPKASHSTRSGTWQYMSAALGRYPNKPHLLSDDLESAYHILNWCALKYLPHSFTDPTDLRREISHLYDYAEKGKASNGKLQYILYGVPFVKLLCDKNHPFPQLLDRLGKLVQRHYEQDPPEAMEEAALDGVFKYPTDPDDPNAQSTDPRPSDGTISLDDPKPVPPHLYNHRHFLDVFRSVLLLDQSRWPAIEKTPDQVPDQSPSSSAGSKRSADYLQDMGPAGAIVKKQKTEARDVDTSGKVSEGTDRVSGSGGPSQDLRNPDAGIRPTTSTSDLRRQALLSNTTESDKTRARPKK